MAPTPFLASGLLMSTPEDLIHVFANKTLEYHTAPSIKYATAAAATASQFKCEKNEVSISASFGYHKRYKFFPANKKDRHSLSFILKEIFFTTF